jgi:hypothetical protein
MDGPKPTFMGWHNAAVLPVRAAIRGSQKILLDETLLSGQSEVSL